MFEVTIDQETKTFNTPQDAVVYAMQSTGVDQIHWMPVFQAVRSLGNGKSFFDHDTGVVITALY